MTSKHSASRRKSARNQESANLALPFSNNSGVKPDSNNDVATDTACRFPQRLCSIPVQPFCNHRDAALALLIHAEGLAGRHGNFLGHVAVIDDLTDRQLNWLQKLLARHGMPEIDI